MEFIEWNKKTLTTTRFEAGSLRELQETCEKDEISNIKFGVVLKNKRME